MLRRWQRNRPPNDSWEFKVQNFFHHDANNVGDQMCGSANYFSEFAAEKRNFSSTEHLASHLIVGGGQIFDQILRLSGVAFDSYPDTSLVCWGAGIPPKGNRDREVYALVEQFSLFGTRNFDWAEELDFVPCVSCMSSVFDNLPAPSHEVVVFAHRKKTPDLFLPEGVPYKTNIGQSAREVACFIASGQTVVTSSYHGVYWAQLLGRRVVCIPFNNKFETFQHKPFFSTPKSWMHELDGASVTKPLLHEYRLINNAFCKKVKHSWGLEE